MRVQILISVATTLLIMASAHAQDNKKTDKNRTSMGEMKTASYCCGIQDESVERSSSALGSSSSQSVATDSKETATQLQ